MKITHTHTHRERNEYNRKKRTLKKDMNNGALRDLCFHPIHRTKIVEQIEIHPEKESRTNWRGGRGVRLVLSVCSQRQTYAKVEQQQQHQTQ